MQRKAVGFTRGTFVIVLLREQKGDCGADEIVPLPASEVPKCCLKVKLSTQLFTPPWQQRAAGVFIVRALSGQHELLMDPDADLSVTSRPPEHKHTHIHTHIHKPSQCCVCGSSFFSKTMTGDHVCSPVTLSNPYKPLASLPLVDWFIEEAIRPSNH